MALVARKKGKRKPKTRKGFHDGNLVDFWLIGCWWGCLIKAMKRKIIEERLSLTLAPAVPTTPIFGGLGERRQRLQRKEKERKKEKDGWCSWWRVMKGRGLLDRKRLGFSSLWWSPKRSPPSQRGALPQLKKEACLQALLPP